MLLARQIHPVFVGEASGLDAGRRLGPATVRATWEAIDRLGDLVISDNRCTMHRGRPFDEAETRDLRRVTTRDAASTVDQVA
jgi:alpha-ketoglutarate-dependent taurine dioxygenase